MDDMKRFLDAVKEMRAAQKLEWDALPANFRLWKRARQKQSVYRLEQTVDGLAVKLLRTRRWTDDNKDADAAADKGQAGESADSNNGAKAN